METCCSLSNLQNILCGESCGMSTNVNLLEFTEDIHIHLVSCHLSKSSLKEYEIILARADLFHLEKEQLKSSLPKSSKHSSLILETSSFLLISRTCRGKTLLQRSWSNAVNLQLSEEVHKRTVWNTCSDWIS